MSSLSARDSVIDSVDEKKVITNVEEKQLSNYSSSDSDSDSFRGAISAELHIPADWPPLATQNMPKFYFWNQWNLKNTIDLEAIATQPSVFDDPDKAPFYQPTPKYESLARVDHRARWTWREEIAIVRKIDLRIMLWCTIMFMALQLDRGNLSQALADNFLKDLGFSTNVYNNGNMIFKLFFLVCEVPSQLVSKKLGPDRWIPIQMISWSVIAISQFWIQNTAGFYLTRALLGAWEGGFIADICLYLSYFYKSAELPVRLAYFWSAMIVAEIIAAFMGYGILHMRGVLGYEGWRWLFLIEGCITAVIGLLACLLMPPSPTKTASWFRGRNGWFSEREQIIIVNRVLRDDPSKGDMHNRQALTWKMIWRSLSDVDLWPIYIIGLVFGISSAPVSTYLTLTLRSIGFSTFQVTLMNIPELVLSLVALLAVTYLSQHFNERSLFGAFSQLWVLAFLIPLRIFNSESNRWAKYAVTMLLLSYPSTHAIQVGWTSRNSNSVRTRTLSSALYNMFCQLSGIISTYIYRADDAPLYKRGNSVLIGIACMNIAVYFGVKAYYIWRNNQRDKKWSILTEAQRDSYIRTTTDEGSRRLDFRFAH
ncbi:major facilitator superfamily domain-containing protein [Limtongia smithiae]|uniref:major facilitator superfamily domain-containing protein n=1 Tax=Limtongia smithiae TaxID=1125753 RepID=UPI0034CFF772